MILFTIGAGTGLPTGISNNTTYTAFVDGALGASPTSATHKITLRDVVANGTTDVITPGVDDTDADDVDLTAYHAQLNEEFLIDPDDLIDSVEEMTVTQKEEFRDAGRINFSNRFEFSRVARDDGTDLADINAFPADVSGFDVRITFHASGLSNVTRITLDFDGNIVATITDTSTTVDNRNVLDEINNGDDVELTVDASLPSITITNETEVQAVITESTSSNPDIPDHILGDLLGAGRTVEDADLVVTPERVESAIHNLTDDAIVDVQETLGIGSSNDGDQIIIEGETYTYTPGETAAGEDTLILTRNRGNVLVGTHIFRADGTVDYMVTGQVISGGGV